MRTAAVCLLNLLSVLSPALTASAQQVTGQDLDKILERADKILEEAKTVYETGRSTSSVEALLAAAFKLEESRIKYLVLQEIGDAQKQKVAADRLRSLNQLTKLVNDARVAISGKPAEPGPVKPADPAAPPPAVEAPQKPVEAPLKPTADAMKRIPVPDVAKQRDAEKLIKEIFKDQYSKKAITDRRGLARLLLDQAGKNQDDPAARWVLCRESQDIAVQVSDVKCAIEAIESAARVFDIDALTLKYDSLLAMGKSAKSPEEYVALAAALHMLVTELVEADQHESAEKAANLALQHLRKTKDAALITRATSRAREVTEGRTIFQAMKASRETLAKGPDDPRANLEMGRFQCFVKGNWDLGLRFLSKGSDTTMKALAERELGRPAQTSDQVALAEAWEELADKEKSALRKSQLFAHARGLYEAALHGASGLMRAKIEKRVTDLSAKANPVSASVVGGVDLLALVDHKKDPFAGSGSWERAGTKILGVGVGFARIEIPYEPSDEYDLKAVIEAGSDTEAVLLLSRQGRAFAVSFYPGQDRGAIYISGPATRFSGIPLPTDRSMTVVVQVRADSVKVYVDEKQCLDWRPDPTTVVPHEAWQPRNQKALGLGATGAKVAFVSLQIAEVNGRGKRLR